MACSPPRVSVIMIFLDEERFIEQAVASVCAQTYGSWELLMVDDGSKDGSTEIAKSFAAKDPSRMRYLEHAAHANLGMSATRNVGLTAAAGEFVAFLDADDVWLPSRLRRGVELLEANPGAAMAYGRTEYWYSWAGAAGAPSDWIQAHGFRADRTVPAPELLTMHLSGQAALPCMGSLTIRRDAALACGGFAEEFRSLYEDQAFLARLCADHDVFVSEERWDLYRQHPDSACAVAEQHGASVAARETYLAWLESYLEQRGLRGTQTWRALERARAMAHAPRWRVRIEDALRRASRYFATAVQRGVRSPDHD